MVDRSRLWKTISLEKTEWGTTHYEFGRYGRMQWEYLKTHRRGEYIRLFMDGKLNEHLHEVDEECCERMEFFVELIKAGAGISEELRTREIKRDKLLYVVIEKQK